MRRAPEIKLSEAERKELAAWSRSQTLPVRQVSRAKIVLLAADGQQDIAIAEGASQRGQTLHFARASQRGQTLHFAMAVT
jgi:hypothetical protein